VVLVCGGGRQNADADNTAKPWDHGGVKGGWLMVWVLNLGWVGLATLMCWLWVRHARREGPGLQVQFIALALVLGMMFVVISIYDDMAMAQNPAETRCFQRKDDLGAHAHAPLHPVMASTPTLAAELPSNRFRFAIPASLLVPTVEVPVLSSIQNRPPPAA
jgi:glucan phosphoethanolaminetransferase (alkaline phosphatase superfamily)